jgi:hypothetical protein
MNLPSASLALVAKVKITDYLLDPAHPDNGGQAEFFHSLGFRRKDWEILARAFRAVAVAAEVAEQVESARHRERSGVTSSASPIRAPGPSRSCR